MPSLYRLGLRSHVYSRVEHLASATSPGGRLGNITVAMMTAFFDASGKLADPNCKWLLLVGLVTTVNKWTKFERDWAKAMRDEKIGEFHMTEFIHCGGEFRSWKNDPDRQEAFLNRLGKIIKKWTMFSVSRGSDLDAYRTVDTAYEYHEHAAYPYAQCGLTAISGVRKELKRRKLVDPILYVFEKGDDHQDQLLDRSRTDMKPSLPMDPIFQPKRWKENGQTHYCLPFQACDYMAWEHGKAFKNWAENPAASLRQPLTWMYGNLRGDWTYQKLESYQGIVKSLKIPRRKTSP